MSFGNPAGDAATAAPAYVRALLDVLGPRDPLEVASELVPWLERRTAGVGDAPLRRPEAPGQWSAIEVIQHLADTEMVYGWRTRLILAEGRRRSGRGWDTTASAGRKASISCCV